MEAYTKRRACASADRGSDGRSIIATLVTVNSATAAGALDHKDGRRTSSADRAGEMEGPPLKPYPNYFGARLPTTGFLRAVIPSDLDRGLRGADRTISASLKDGGVDRLWRPGGDSISISRDVRCRYGQLRLGCERRFGILPLSSRRISHGWNLVVMTDHTGSVA
jgi:hypothetical protein